MTLSRRTPNAFRASTAASGGVTTGVPGLAWSSAASTASSPMTTDADVQEKQIASSGRSEEHTSELQSLMRISYAVFCLKKKKIKKTTPNHTNKQMYTQLRATHSTTKIKHTITAK